MKIKLTLLICLTLMMAKGFAQGENVTDVMAAAKAGYAHYLQKIPVGHESRYGFNHRGEFELVKIGKPYQILNITYDFFSDTTLVKSNYLFAIGEWRVPLSVNGEYRTLITISNMNGTLKVVGLGAAALAKELGVFEHLFPSPNPSGAILRVHQLETDYFLSSLDFSSMDLKMYPLMMDHAGPIRKNTIPPHYTISEILSMVKTFIKTR